MGTCRNMVETRGLALAVIIDTHKLAWRRTNLWQCGQPEVGLAVLVQAGDFVHV